MTKYARTALNETWLILATWCGFCTWVMVACARHYRPTAAVDTTVVQGAVLSRVPVVTVWGIPDWVFWGIAVPWMTATTLTILLALVWLKVEPTPEEIDG